MTETSSKPLDYEFGEKHINFRIERTMANDIRCGYFDYLSDLTASVVSNYNLVKLDSISTKDYQSINYPYGDESEYGFFITERRYADVDNAYRLNRQARLLTRWAPDRSEVVYYLSDEFNKPENKLLKQAAYKTIERVNDGLDDVGVQFRLRLDEKAGLSTGDMRYNMIILQEDLNWLLGYSPSVVHPRTGEILASRVVLFSGALKQHVWETYEQIREERAKEIADKASDKKETETKNNAGKYFSNKESTSGDKSESFDKDLVMAVRKEGRVSGKV